MATAIVLGALLIADSLDKGARKRTEGEAFFVLLGLVFCAAYDLVSLVQG